MHASHDYTQQGLLMSLASALPDPDCPLARKAHRIARKLNRGPRDRALVREASDLLADLLTRTDAGLPLESEGLLDDRFDD